MTKQTPFYLQKLRAEFELRASRRKGYSLRSYALFLGVEAPSLSSVLKGSRRLSKTKVEKVADKLNLSPKERLLFIDSNQRRPSVLQVTNDIQRKQLNSETHFRIIAEWEHYAILSLLETKDFQSSSKWISERLNIPDLRARICIDNLLEAKLILLEGKRFVLNQQGLSTSEDISSQAIRIARRQDLELAQNSIDEISVELRDLSSSTMTLDPKDLPELKAMIRDFRKRFMLQAENKKSNEVYKLAVQLFPLTKLRGKNESN